MTFILEKIRETAKVIQGRIVMRTMPVGPIKIIPCDYKENNTPPTDSADWKEYKGEELVAPMDSHWWVKFSVEVPKADDKRIYRLYAETGKGGWDALNPQCTLFLDGDDTAVQAFDVNHLFANLTEGHHDVVIYLYNGMNSASNFRINFTLKEIDTDTEGLWYDITVPFEAAKCLPRDSMEYNQIMNVLNRATIMLDLRQRASKEYFDSVAAARKFMMEEFYEKICGNLTAGLATSALLFFSVVCDYFGCHRSTAFLTKSGQNPMVAYVAGDLVVYPLLNLTGGVALLWPLYASPWLGLLHGVVLTTLSVLLTMLTTKLRLFWRT